MSQPSLAALPLPAAKVRSTIGSSKFISMHQATNIDGAVRFAKLIDLPLVAHLTIHWAFTNVGDDPDGTLFAKVREGLNKWTCRRGFNLTCVWVRERLSRGQAEVVHCHLLFYLPAAYRKGARLLHVKGAIAKLVRRHGRGYWADEVVDLRIHDNPDGKYFLKGGGPRVWRRFGLRKEQRSLQGLNRVSAVARLRI